MITEDYVSFETAKLLKEKGFDEPCTVSFFDKDSYREWIETAPRPLYADSESAKPFTYQRPTLQMAMKWLREVHNIHINLDIHWLYFANTLGWMYVITRILENGVDYVDAKGDEDDKTFYSTYEEACEAAIKYCLKNLI